MSIPNSLTIPSPWTKCFNTLLYISQRKPQVSMMSIFQRNTMAGWVQLQGHTTFEPNFELPPQKSPWHGDSEHQQVYPSPVVWLLRSRMGSTQVTTSTKASLSRPRSHQGSAHHNHWGTWIGVRPWWKALCLAAGCWQAEWLPWLCQVVIKLPGTQDLPTKGVQGQWRLPPNSRNHRVFILRPASPSPTALDAAAVWKGRVWTESWLNNSVIRSRSLFGVLQIRPFQRDKREVLGPLLGSIIPRPTKMYWRKTSCWKRKGRRFCNVSFEKLFSLMMLLIFPGY